MKENVIILLITNSYKKLKEEKKQNFINRTDWLSNDIRCKGIGRLGYSRSQSGFDFMKLGLCFIKINLIRVI